MNVGMSALGTKRTFRDRGQMSAFRGTADIAFYRRVSANDPNRAHKDEEEEGPLRVALAAVPPYATAESEADGWGRGRLGSSWQIANPAPPNCVADHKTTTCGFGSQEMTRSKWCTLWKVVATNNERVRAPLDLT